jgi:hypothetical protein
MVVYSSATQDISHIMRKLIVLHSISFRLYDNATKNSKLLITNKRRKLIPFSHQIKSDTKYFPKMDPHPDGFKFEKFVITMP